MCVGLQTEHSLCLLCVTVCESLCVCNGTTEGALTVTFAVQKPPVFVTRRTHVSLLLAFQAVLFAVTEVCSSEHKVKVVIIVLYPRRFKGLHITSPGIATHQQRSTKNTRRTIPTELRLSALEGLDEIVIEAYFECFNLIF
jgi:hypothetical protein